MGALRLRTEKRPDALHKIIGIGATQRDDFTGTDRALIAGEDVGRHLGGVKNDPVFFQEVYGRPGCHFCMDFDNDAGADNQHRRCQSDYFIVQDQAGPPLKFFQGIPQRTQTAPSCAIEYLPAFQKREGIPRKIRRQHKYFLIGPTAG